MAKKKNEKKTKREHVSVESDYAPTTSKAAVRALVQQILDSLVLAQAQAQIDGLGELTAAALEHVRDLLKTLTPADFMFGFGDVDCWVWISKQEVISVRINGLNEDQRAIARAIFAWDQRDNDDVRVDVSVIKEIARFASKL
jgi:hypothetical protein